MSSFKNISNEFTGTIMIIMPPCKILRTILEVDKGRTSTNGLKNKNTNDDA